MSATLAPCSAKFGLGWLKLPSNFLRLSCCAHMYERKIDGEECTRFWLNQIYTQRLRGQNKGHKCHRHIFTVCFSMCSFFPSISLILQVDWAFVSACWCLFNLSTTFVIAHMLAWCTATLSELTLFWMKEKRELAVFEKLEKRPLFQNEREKMNCVFTCQA